MRLDRHAQLFRDPGPFLSVYFDVSRETEDAEHRLRTRWDQARRRLLDDGAPAALVDEAGRRVLEPTGRGGAQSRMIVANGDGVQLDDRVGRSPREELAVWSALPQLTPWIADRHLDLPVLVAVVDHTGADLCTYRPWPDRQLRQIRVEGTTEHLQKVRHPRVAGRHGARGAGGQPGGGTPSGEWLRGDVQRRTDEVHRHNARLVAAEVDRLARGVDLVVLAGEPEPCAEVAGAVAPETTRRLRVLERGSRAADGSDASLEEAVRGAVGEAVDEAELRLRDDFEQRRGRGRGFAEGVRDVLEASVQGRVETLLLDPDRAAAIRVRPADVEGLSLPGAVDPGDERPADQVAVAAVARTGGEVMAVQSESISPLAATLRWSG